MNNNFAEMRGSYPQINAPGADQLSPIGARLSGSDGRVWYYVEAAGTIAAGALAQSAADMYTSTLTAGMIGPTLSGTVAVGQGGAIGDTEIRVNDCVAALTQNEAQGGFLLIEESTGHGYMYKIMQHDAITTATGQSADITIAEPGLVVALAATTVARVIKSAYVEVIEYAGTIDEALIVGVASGAFTSTNKYGWVQTWGLCPVRCDDTSWLDTCDVVPGTSKAGEVAVQTSALHEAAGGHAVGYSPWAYTAENGFGAVYLTIAP